MIEAHMGALGFESDQFERLPFADDNTPTGGGGGAGAGASAGDKENVSPATQYLPVASAADAGPAPHSHCALVLLKPEAVQRGLVGEVVRRFEHKGFELSAMRMAEADPLVLPPQLRLPIAVPLQAGRLEVLPQQQVQAQQQVPPPQTTGEITGKTTRTVYHTPPPSPFIVGAPPPTPQKKATAQAASAALVVLCAVAVEAVTVCA